MTSYIQNLNNTIQSAVKTFANDISKKQSQGSTIDRLKMSAVLKLITKFVGQSIPFASRNGFKVIDFKPGYVKALIPLKANTNHFNAMYAGALFTVAELPGGIISVFSFDERFFPVLKDFKIDFLKMAKTDVTVEFSISAKELERIEQEAIKHKKCPFVLQGEIKDKNGEIVATTYANYQVRLR